MSFFASLRRIAAVSSILLLSHAVQANPWYRVELMLVAYQDEETIDHELWPDAIVSEPPAVEITDKIDKAQHSYEWWLKPEAGDVQATTNDPSQLWSKFGVEETPDSQFLQPLTQLEHLIFADKATKINRRSDMQVIWHQAWIEPIQNEDQAIQHPIDVSLQDKLNIQLRGTVQLHVSRYLHINTDLQIQHYELMEPNELAALTLAASHNEKSDYRVNLLGDSEISLSEPQLIPVRSAKIQQSRRMRSKELHYVDHPMLGLVVKVIPIETKDDVFNPDKN